MAETTTAETPVVQAQDVETRMANFLTQFETDQGEEVQQPQADPEPTAPQAEVAEQPEGQATDELTPEDIPELEAQPTTDAFEIVHNGTQHKLSRADTIKYAQQGFDYTQKAQALAEERKAVAVSLQKAQEIEQMQAALGGAMAEVKAIEAQLQPWANVDWVQVATNEPLDYPKYRAQYDVLVSNYQRAVGKFNQQAETVKQERSQITAKQVQQEMARIPELVPSWSNPAKREAGSKDVIAYLEDRGVGSDIIQAISNCQPIPMGAMAIAILNDAAQYRKLLKAKTEKVKQLRTAPPVTKASGESAAQTNTGSDQRLMDRLKKTGDKRDAAALLAQRMK